MAVKIFDVEKKSPCSRKRIKGGYILHSINGFPVNDVLDYRFYIDSETRVMKIENLKGKIKDIKIRKKEAEDPGLVFETYLMDKQRHCKNKCIFCFIDQLPKGMRDSLYFKDDDSRLSFLFGNYITLTNLTESEVQRIIDMHISPVNVSVHTMNPKLRCEMMNNRFAGDCLKYLKMFADAGISLNTQLVLCPGINDGDELRYSLDELFKLYPSVKSIAAVPVGLTDHREGLFELSCYTKEKAAEVIDIIDSFNERNVEKDVPRLAFAADEFFLKAERDMPDSSYYVDYPQLENGVGLWNLLKETFIEALSERKDDGIERKISIATGKAAYPLMLELSQLAMKKFARLDINVYEIENRFFGKNITVAGLLTGRDIADQLKDKEIGDRLLLPSVALRRERDVFLDDMTPEELSEALSTEIAFVDNDGELLLSAIL